MNFKLLILFLLVFSLVSCLNGNILVTIEGNEIDSDYFNDVYALSGGGMSKLQFFNDVMIPDEILFIEAERKGIEEPTDLEIEKVISDFGGDSLKENTGLSNSKLKELVKKKIIVAKLLIKVLPPPLVTDDEINQFYSRVENLPSGTSRADVHLLLTKAKSEMLKRDYVLSIVSNYKIEIAGNVEELLGN